MQEKYECIGANIRRLRKLSGLTQGQVAQALNVSYQQVQKYEAGANRIPIEKLFELRHFYNVPYETFFEGFDEAERPHLDAGNHKAELYTKLAKIKDHGLLDKVERVVLIFLE